MKRILSLIACWLFVSAFAQQDAWVYFADKPNAAGDLADPLGFLSQRALDRRAAQGIALDFRDAPLEASYVSTIASSPGIELKARSKWFNCVHVRGSQTDISALAALPFVDHVHFADASLNGPSPRLAPSQRHQAVNKKLDVLADYPYGTSGNQIQLMNGHQLHLADYTGEGKMIAVLDAGFPGVDSAPAFSRLHDQGLILGGYDFVHDAPEFYTGGSHGTLVLSTMGGFLENELIGTAPNAAYYLFITEDIAEENPVEESYWVEAAERADSLGVDIINTSLGYFAYDNPAYGHTYADMDGVSNFISKGADIAFSRGMVVVVSAGNNATTPEPHIGAPADALQVLSVGAVDPAGQYASFSSIGPSSDGRIKPDVAAPGAGIYVAQPWGTVSLANGTSFACPITAGLIACLWQALPDKTNAEIRELVRQSASLFETPNMQLGYGIPDFNLALSLGTGDLKEGFFAAYPNPVHDFLTVVLPEKKAVQFLLFDASGRRLRIFNFSEKQTTIDVSNLPAGLYFYRISGAVTRSGKVLKY